MSYLIAVGSSDEVHVDLKFGEAEKVIIYEVEGTNYSKKEVREFNIGTKETEQTCSTESCKSCTCSGSGQGCNGGSDVENKIRLIGDCRCVLFKKVGFQAQKQFERKAISVFDIECEISEALKKITEYYAKTDAHKRYTL
ncbi:MAG: hypothetical protein K6G75_12170 [Lachnospiraceae bacterium]|nr:hypothetical protein [Lachnospiraceae bacterium]